MKIKAILMDMDGTLLGRSQVAISPRNMEAVQRAIHQGVQVIPCTGRVLEMLPPQLLSQEGLRYFVLSHGARAYDRQKKKTLYEHLIPPELSATLLERIEGKALYCEIAAQCTIYTEKSVTDALDWRLVPEHHLWYMRDRYYTPLKKPSQFFRENNIGVEKFNLYNVPAPLQEDLFQALSEGDPVYHTKPKERLHLEFLAKGLKKMNAVYKVLEACGIAPEETLAIGDSATDADIIRASGIGVAMGNAPDDIKAIADEVTDLNTEDGLAKAFERFVF